MGLGRSDEVAPHAGQGNGFVATDRARGRTGGIAKRIALIAACAVAPAACTSGTVPLQSTPAGPCGPTPPSFDLATLHPCWLTRRNANATRRAAAWRHAEDRGRPRRGRPCSTVRGEYGPVGPCRARLHPPAGRIPGVDEPGRLRS